MTSTGRKKFIKDYDVRTLAAAFDTTLRRVQSAKEKTAEDGRLDFVIDPENKRRYLFVSKLGEGAYGRVYTAVRYNSQTVRDVIKIFMINGDTMPADSTGDPRVRQYGDNKLNAEAAQREYCVSKAIQRRLGIEFCEQRVVCAKNYFVLDELERGFLRFPFVAANNLDRYLTERIYPTMLSIRQRLDSVGYGKYTLADMVRLQYPRIVQSRISLMAKDELRALLTDLASSYNIVVSVGLITALQLATTLMLLHNKYIFHRDIKVENVLVRDSAIASDVDVPTIGALGMRSVFIDFGVSCAFERDDDNEVEEACVKEAQRSLVFCDEYLTTPDYRDPLISYTDRLSSAEDSADSVTLEQNMKFDTYAFGKLLQELFDPYTIDAGNGIRQYPLVRATEFMPDGLLDLIRDMTGDPPGFETLDPEPRLRGRELAERIERYKRRPSMRTVLRRLDSIVKAFDERGQLELDSQ
jgi:serine/threonine protein kinase